MRVRLKKSGRDHLVRIDDEGSPTYETLCGQRIPPAEEHPPRWEDPICVQCRRAELVEAGYAVPVTAPRTKPLRDPCSDAAERWWAKKPYRDRRRESRRREEIQRRRDES